MMDGAVPDGLVGWLVMRLTKVFDGDALSAKAVSEELRSFKPDARSYRETAALLSSSLRCNPALSSSLCSRALSVPAALAAAAAQRAATDAARACMSEHHQRLRAAVAQSSHVGSAWKAALSADNDALDRYAESATDVGRRRWARTAQAWCEAAAAAHARGETAGRAAAKAARRAHWAAHGCAPPHELAEAAAVAAAEAHVTARGGRAPRLLDVGSCHDPWRHLHGSLFDVLAFDLRPGADTVYAADLFEVEVGSELLVSPPASASDGAGVLRCLPRGSFSVAVLSLVLSYLPHPEQRVKAVALTRSLLRDDGLLLIVRSPRFS